jgi:hypothetical protein
MLFAIELVLMHRNTHYVILIDVIGTLMCSDDCSSLSVNRPCNT